MKRNNIIGIALAFSIIGLFLICFIISGQPKYKTKTHYETVKEQETISSAEEETVSLIAAKEEFVASSFIPVTIPELETETETETEAETTAAQAYWQAQKTYAKVGIPEDYQQAFINLCEHYDFSYELFLAWAYTESRWHFDSVSGSGAIGIMQIMPCYWETSAAQLGMNIREPIGNVNFALYLITEYLKKSGGDMAVALNAYNGNSWYAALVFENYEYLFNNGYFN